MGAEELVLGISIALVVDCFIALDHSCPRAHLNRELFLNLLSLFPNFLEVLKDGESKGEEQRQVVLVFNLYNKVFLVAITLHSCLKLFHFYMLTFFVFQESEEFTFVSAKAFVVDIDFDGRFVLAPEQQSFLYLWFHAHLNCDFV